MQHCSLLEAGRQKGKHSNPDAIIRGPWVPGAKEYLTAEQDSLALCSLPTAAKRVLPHSSNLLNADALAAGAHSSGKQHGEQLAEKQVQCVKLSSAYGQRSKNSSKKQRKAQRTVQRSQVHITRSTGGISKTVKNRRGHRLAIQMIGVASNADVLICL